jgi:hypothetical protein
VRLTSGRAIAKVGRQSLRAPDAEAREREGHADDAADQAAELVRDEQEPETEGVAKQVAVCARDRRDHELQAEHAEDPDELVVRDEADERRQHPHERGQGDRHRDRQPVHGRRDAIRVRVAPVQERLARSVDREIVDVRERREREGNQAEVLGLQQPRQDQRREEERDLAPEEAAVAPEEARERLPAQRPRVGGGGLAHGYDRGRAVAAAEAER